MKRTALSIFILVISMPALCQQLRYVDDKLEVTMRSGMSTKHEILRVLSSGTKLELLESNSESGYSLVRTPSGAEGWVLNRFLVASPPAHILLPGIQEKLKNEQAEVSKLRQRLKVLSQEKSQTEAERDKLNGQSMKLSRELAEIKRVSSNAINLAEQNRKLQDQVVESSREIQLLRQENDSLKDRSNRDWFLVGAIVVVAAMLFGIMLTRIQWRKKSSWGEL